MRVSTPTCRLLAVLLGLASCDKKANSDGDDKAKQVGQSEQAKAAAQEPEEPTLMVAENEAPVAGPVPPETDMVFFGIEGALIPLACFSKDSKKLTSGAACLKMVSAGSDVRIASKFSGFTKKAGELAVPQCLIGTDQKIAITVEGITEGADFIYGTWPPSGARLVTHSADDSTSPTRTALAEADKAALAAAIKVVDAQGDLQANQVAEIDLDGDGKLDKIFALFVPDPKLPEAHRTSALVVAPGGDTEALQLVEQIARKPDVFETRGALDLDGDGHRELWVRRMSEDGSAGERIYQLDGGRWTGIGPWTCGAV